MTDIHSIDGRLPDDLRALDEELSSIAYEERPSFGPELRAELARAVVESMAYQTRDVVDAMAAASGQTLTELRVDGGASVMDVLLQIQADQLGVTVSRPTNQETTALGAAYLAGLAEGVWDSPEAVNAGWDIDKQFQPNPDRTEADRLHQRWLAAVDRSKGWAESTG